jgi:hypothetical protein
VRNLRSFVVKVYRQQAGLVAGTVQDVQTGRTVPFQGMEELWRAIGATRSGSERASLRPCPNRAERCTTDENEGNT